jgi:hypothetical protein
MPMVAMYAWAGSPSPREPPMSMSAPTTITRPTPASPTQLDSDMSRRDLIDVLSWIEFPRKSTVLIEIDRGVRDYLVGVLRDR